MDSFFAASRLSLGSSSNTNPSPQWSFGAPQQVITRPASSSVTPGAASLFGSPTSVAPSSPPTFTPLHAQDQSPKSPLDGLLFAAVGKDIMGLQLTKKITDPSSILNGDIQILRIYLPLEQLPLQWLEEAYFHCQKQNSNPLREVHLCVRSPLRPCLQDIDEDPVREQAMKAMVEKWAVVNTVLKFFFLRPDVQAGRDRFQNFVEKDLMQAIEGLQDGDVELSDILGEESVLYDQLAASSYSFGASSTPVVVLDDEMI
ncbi:hypothetical protein EJ02DRAFT_431401 [Clathrospora elynae]|uniref:Uncharacterized protein n=1 Tax=Clathrospora elynae TaxID=706981 RepID=A0A6A5T4C5_9PLEO|nr:hypothetical protein EJ02DRAFT_431401 [Clathrospora elynae]